MAKGANDLQKKIIADFKEKGGVAFLFKVGNQRGISDIIGIIKGQAYIIEVKQYYSAGKDELSKLQEYQMKRFKDAGAITFTVYAYTDYLINMEMNDAN